MSDRPIIFSAPMVRALLDGRKTQTRRILKGAPSTHMPFHGIKQDGYATWEYVRVKVPYAVGDRLWVRENVKRLDRGTCDQRVVYMADGFCPHGEGQNPYSVPSIHMPRWASRLTLVVTGVKVERLQDISEEDAIAEGLLKLKATGRYVVEQGAQHFGGAFFDPRRTFADLWVRINGPESWDANPWVSALTFTVHRCNIDDMETPDVRATA